MDPEGRSGPPPEGDAAEADGRGAQRLLRATWEWSRSILMALALFLVIRSMGLEAFKIPTGSMEGTILVGDFLLVNKAVYGAEIPGTDLHLPALAEPQRGDIVVFSPPHEMDRNYVKRLVGLPGDTLQMLDKVLLVNGEPLQEPYVRHVDGRGDAFHPRMRWQRRHLLGPQDPASYHPSRDNWGPIEVPADSLFVLGDNRDNSEDSRYWGFVPREALKGRPWRVYYSLDSHEGSGLSWLKDVRWDRIGGRIR